MIKKCRYIAVTDAMGNLSTFKNINESSVAFRYDGQGIECGWGYIWHPNYPDKFGTMVEILEKPVENYPLTTSECYSRESLLEEAKRRYPIGTKYKNAHNLDNSIFYSS